MHSVNNTGNNKYGVYGNYYFHGSVHLESILKFKVSLKGKLNKRTL